VSIIGFGGHVPSVAADAFVADSAVVIGDVEIGPEASVWFGCVLRGDHNRIRVGARTNIQDGTVVHINAEHDGGRGRPGWCTTIGADVTVGHMALIHGCTLEDGCFIGMKACVMDGVVVETGGMVAAGALVTPGKRVRKGELWAGSPAKLWRPISPAELENFAYAVRHYVETAAAFRREAR
jgi:carbonic anhydrase/acetyltransferase-like protein (isoleucine patch superfamily)